MHFSLIRRAFAAFLVAVLVSACGGGSSAPPPVGGLTVVPGDGQITVSWKSEPGVQYWLFYAPASSISTDNWTNVPGAQALINVTSPYVLTGLANTVVYSFVVNARTGDGPGGASTPSVSSIPRAAGEKWNPGSNVGPPLQKFGLRAYIGGVLPNTPDNLVRWLQDPPSVDPRTAMPNLGVSLAEAGDIAAHLYTLR